MEREWREKDQKMKETRKRGKRKRWEVRRRGYLDGLHAIDVFTAFSDEEGLADLLDLGVGHSAVVDRTAEGRR